MELDLVITNGTVATASDTFRADIGIRDGRIAAIAENLSGAREIDASGKLVLPGGVEAHCHIAQESATGGMTADDYRSGSISAAFGGNSSFIPFAAQHRGVGVTETLDLYDSRAEGNSVIDYGYHLIVADPTEEVLRDELPQAFARGITSFKVFMTYDLMKIDDGQFLDILSVAKTHGALTMVHAENSGIIRWISDRLVAAGHTQPRYHAVSHPAAAESEAINRAITLARFVDAPLLIVHVSTTEGAGMVAQARLEGAKIFGETCPQYLFLTKGDLDRPSMEGAKFMCSPPVRDAGTQEALWRHLQAGTFSVFSSDHAPYRFDESGKLANGPDATFKQIANGMPGIALRLPLLFSEGVRAGRITLNQFVALGSTNAAKLYGMHPEKGTIAIGSDADIAIWDPEETRTVTVEDQHDNMDYTPFEGQQITGWPVTVLSRGETVMDGGKLVAKPGRGRFIARRPPDFTGYPGTRTPELDPARNFGADIAP
ncbi:dihydropyrimidinase [Paracoccus saliphilus]|uniref:D-hydantoinase n=1 Tax=Paracoccus saliphilus TaxID=405559 RepID=A0AA45W442_9RHOB|nr:dihydropyrimidinase [Paracoccus saliphilus]WCR04195.1 dihydropyrimidinase [Paracoccus saliphilus]SIS81248.1 dihydropyrimidinase [Paracoccus saliphilus]